MEKVAKALAAVENVAGINKKDMIAVDSARTKEARALLCHAVSVNAPKSVFALSVVLGLSPEKIRFIADDTELSARSDSDIRWKTLRVAELMENGVETLAQEEPPCLGWTYTEAQEERIKQACKDSAEFMSSYGAGIKPLREGYPLSRS